MSARTILKHLYKEGRMTDYQYERIDRCLKGKQGEWIPQTDFDGFTYWKCSKCNKKNDFEIFNFCPNCGADMRGEVN